MLREHCAFMRQPVDVGLVSAPPSAVWESADMASAKVANTAFLEGLDPRDGRIGIHTNLNFH